MKKAITLLLLAILLLTFLSSCTMCFHEFETVKKVAADCETNKPGSITEVCSICGYEKTSVIQAKHNFVSRKCNDYQVCTTCGTKNGIYVKHTTTNGTCSRCNTVIEDQNTKLQKEYDRHQWVVNNLKMNYNYDISSIENRIRSCENSCLYSRSECQTKIYSIDQEIRSLQSQSSGGSLSGSGFGNTNALNNQLRIQQLYSERSRYQDILNKWNEVDALKLEKIEIQEQYNADLYAENQLHERNLSQIRSSK